MPITDWVLVALLAIGFYRGYKSGLVMQLVLIAGVFVAVYLSGELSLGMVEKINASNIDNPVPLLRISFFLTLIFIYSMAWLIGKSLSKAVHLMLLGTLNRVFGGLLGALKTALIACALITLSAATNWVDPNLYSGALTQWLKQTGTLIFPRIKHIEEASVILNEAVDLPQ